MRQTIMVNSAVKAARSAASSNELTNNWLRRLQQTSTTPDSRDAHSQLQSVLDFYNKSASTNVKPIDWEGFKERIHTPGVVEKIQAKYNKFMSTEYAVDSAVSKCGTQTEKMQALDIAMTYNYMLYMVHYLAHLNQIETVKNIGDMSMMSTLELQKLMPEIETLQSMQSEIGNLAPQDYVENGVYSRLVTQFSWGSRYCPPFVHSSDSITCVTATMAKSGK